MSEYRVVLIAVVLEAVIYNEISLRLMCEVIDTPRDATVVFCCVAALTM